MSGRTVGRVSGYPVWQQTPVLSRSVARRLGKERKRDTRDRSLALLLERVIRGMVATWYFRSSTNEPSKLTSSTGSPSFFAPPEGELWNKHRSPRSNRGCKPFPASSTSITTSFEHKIIFSTNFSLSFRDGISNVVLSNAVYSGQMNRECRQFRVTCYRDTRYRLSKSTSISDASGENRDIDFEHRSRAFENSDEDSTNDSE
ncbi:hypothetical protein G5I_00727 [Acromyrmex echinatior]|uniref:Uncharacterized protein n=1 Tax=Acromyrmex echinatior TaxID=103372 RepID=F4W5M9_ACREC|nr:hypothetical protein G5I_00727 [Acromyrmex echinatior]